MVIVPVASSFFQMGLSSRSPSTPIRRQGSQRRRCSIDARLLFLTAGLRSFGERGRKIFPRTSSMAPCGNGTTHHRCPCPPGSTPASSPQEFSKILRRWAYDSKTPFISAVRTPSAQPKYQKSQGARAMRKREAAADETQRPTPEAATSYRALSARCNYLAHDIPDIAFAATELCRASAAPYPT